MQVSVIICTWNRWRLLEQTLQQMTALRAPSASDWELLVVNNNCTDDTDAVLERFGGRLPLRPLFEQKQGHSNARNCGLRAAQGDLIVYTDDDVLVEPSWLAELCAAAERWPEAAFFAGRVNPWFEKSPPPALAQVLEAVSEGFCGIDLGPEERYLSAPESPKGANMAFRRQAIASLQFDPELGIKGSIETRGDETSFCEQITKAGGRGVWVPRAVLKHFVPADRIGLSYIKRFCIGLGQTYVRRGELADGSRIAGVPRWLLRRYCEALAKRALSVVSLSSAFRYRTMTDLWRLQGMIQESRLKTAD